VPHAPALVVSTPDAIPTMIAIRPASDPFWQIVVADPQRTAEPAT
jgi:hypothetical protein